MKLCTYGLIFALLFSLFGPINQVEASGIVLKKVMEYNSKDPMTKPLHITEDGSILVPIEDERNTYGFRLISKDGKVLWTHTLKETYDVNYGLVNTETVYIMKDKDITLLNFKNNKNQTYKVTDKVVQDLLPAKVMDPLNACYVTNKWDYMVCIDLKTNAKKEYNNPNEINTLVNTDQSYVNRGFPSEEIMGYLDPITNDQYNIEPKDATTRSKKYNGYWMMGSGSFFYEPDILYYYQDDSIYSEKTGLSYSDATLFAMGADGKRVFEVNNLGDNGGLWVENGISYIGSTYFNPKNINDSTSYIKIVDPNGKILHSLEIPFVPSFIFKHKDRLIVQDRNFTIGHIISYEIKGISSYEKSCTSYSSLNTTNDETYYTDYQKGHYWSEDLLWAIEKGLIKGYLNVKNEKTCAYENFLKPTNELTEAQALTILYRYFKPEQLANTKAESNWYASIPYQLAKADGIETKGSLTNQTDAQSTVTRGDLAVMLVSIQLGYPVDIEEAVQFMYDANVSSGYADSTGHFPKTFESYGIEKPLIRAHIVAFIKRMEEYIQSETN